MGAAVLGAGSILLTAWWAVAFAGIYTRPITRVEASEWIFQNVPGPLTLHIQTGEESYSQPLSLPYGQTVNYQSPYSTSFIPNQPGLLTEVAFKDVLTGGGAQLVTVSVTETGGLDLPVYVDSGEVVFSADSAPLQLVLTDEDHAVLPGSRTYILEVGLFSGDTPLLLENGYLRLQSVSGEISLPIAVEPVTLEANGSVFSYSFTTAETVSLVDLTLFLGQIDVDRMEEQTFRILLDTDPQFSNPVVSEPVTVTGLGDGVSREGGVFTLEQPLLIEFDRIYHLRIENLTEGGTATFQGASLANEGAWDDGLPCGSKAITPTAGSTRPTWASICTTMTTRKN